jgi:programmed cell death 6-interacting protein
MIEDLRFRMETDDIHDAVLEEQKTVDSTNLSPADFEDLFSRRLDTHYAENRNEYRLDQAESMKLRSKLRDVNTLFIKSRRTDTSLEDRERALQKLETGYAKFLEIAQNLDEGRKFYNELAKMLGRWREEIRGFVYQRKKEAKELEGDLSLEMSALKITETPKPPAAERRMSTRTTRSVSRQVKEETESKEGNHGMWTPGTIQLNLTKI